jgi:PAS domain S-box-containing protein
LCTDARATVSLQEMLEIVCDSDHGWTASRRVLTMPQKTTVWCSQRTPTIYTSWASLLVMIGEPVTVDPTGPNRKNLLNTSHQSEPWLRLVLQNTSDVICVLGAVGTFLYVSPAIESVLGYLPENLIGTVGFDYVRPEDAAFVTEAFSQILKTPGVHAPVEFRARAADGSLRHVEAIPNNQLADPILRGVVVTFRDLTERVRAEEEARFHARLLDAVGEAVIATDRQGKIVYWNRAAEESYGWSAEEATGRSVLEVALPEQTPSQRGEIMLGLREGRSWSGEFGLRRKDGTVFPAMVTTTPVVNEGSDLEGIISVSTDITERKRAEEALRRSQKRFRSLVQNSSDVITILDEDGTVRYASPALGQIIGYAPEERVGRRGFELIHPEDRERMLRVYAEVRKVPGVRRAAEVRCRHKDGSWRHLEAIVHNLLEDPSVRGMVVNARDVTERVRTEARLREAEERYRTLIEQIPAVTYIDRADGSDEPLYTSPRIEELLGYTPQEWLEGRLWPERLHPDDRERVLVADEHFESGAGEQFSEEYRLIAKDGSVVWVREEAVLVEDELGNPLFW